MSIYISSFLSVSRKEKLNCQQMAQYLSTFGIVTSITPNFSTQPDMENGCRLVQSISSKNDLKIIWDKISDKYNFKCGHLYIPNGFDGCILDYLAPSKCNYRE